MTTVLMAIPGAVPCLRCRAGVTPAAQAWRSGAAPRHYAHGPRTCHITDDPAMLRRCAGGARATSAGHWICHQRRHSRHNFQLCRTLVRCRGLQKYEAETGRQEHHRIPPGALIAAGLCLALVLASNAQAMELPDAAGAQLKQTFQGLDQFQEGVGSGFLLIFFSELGDKTFFIALLLSLKQSKPVVFAGTFGALAIMTVISVALGEILHKADQVLPFNGIPVDDIAATALLIFFGVRTLQDAANADEAAKEERGEASQAVAQLEAGKVGALLASTFTLVFAAEWGDKSFLATIALAASADPVGVTLGAVAGHGVATGFAVLGGSLLSRSVSEQAVQYLGGSLFLVFAAGSLYDIYQQLA